MIKKIVRRKAGARKGRKFVRRNYRMRTKPSNVKWVSEMYYAGSINSNDGGFFSTRFIDLPQAANYSALYQEFCIKKMTVKLLPYFASSDPNQISANAAATPAITQTYQARLLTSVQLSSQQVAPTSELDVMTDNDCKIRTNNGKPITLVCYPQPDLAAAQPGTLFTSYVATNTKTQKWLNTDNSQVTSSGTSVVHNGIRWWLNVPTSPSGLKGAYYDVYIRVVVGLRNPA